jgi:hypothetical protein
MAKPTLTIRRIIEMKLAERCDPAAASGSGVGTSKAIERV